MENNIIISAKSSEEFLKLEAKLKTLPESILSQVERVENSFTGTTLYFKQRFNSNENTYYIGNDVNHIKNYGDYIGCHSKYFFYKIPVNIDNSYVMVSLVEK